MCNLSEGVLAKGMAKGIETGRTNGILGSIRSLMKNMGVSVEQAMSVLDIPEAERQKYLDLLEEK